MDQTILSTSIQIVSALFVAFGGFLIGIAPPGEADSRFFVGVGSFVSLITLLLMKAVSQRHLSNKYRKRWMIAVSLFSIAFIFAVLFYKQKYETLTFEYPPGSTRAEYISGTELTPTAADYKRDHPDIDNAHLLASFGGLEYKQRVWSKQSMSRARMWLIATYLAVVLSLSSSLFAITQVVLGQAVRPKVTK